MICHCDFKSVTVLGDYLSFVGEFRGRKFTGTVYASKSTGGLEVEVKHDPSVVISDEEIKYIFAVAKALYNGEAEVQYRDWAHNVYSPWKVDSDRHTFFTAKSAIWRLAEFEPVRQSCYSRPAGMATRGWLR